MPLLSKMLPLRETIQDFDAASLHSSQQHQQEKSVREETDNDSGYEDFQEFDDDECLDSDMEGSVDSMLHRGRPKKVVRVPAIPARNERRASTILDNVMLELKALDGAAPKEPETRSVIQESDPHESYLSSEEDASFSDDYEDTDSLHSSSDAISPLEGTSEEAAQESATRRSRRKSQEDTARVVSFICVGKPQIVDIFIHSNHTSPVEKNCTDPPKRYSMDLEALTALTQSSSTAKSTRRPTPLKLYPSSIRRLSISSLTPSHTSASSTNTSSNTSNPNSNHPPRKSSRLASLTSLVTSTKNTLQTSFSASATPTHSFLASDPYSATSVNTEPTTPKTPTSIAAQAWKRTLNRARRPSMPKLSLAYNNSSMANLSLDSTSSPEKRVSRRVSTSHSNSELLKEGLARIISENNSRSSIHSSSAGCSDSSQPQPEPQQCTIKRAETLPTPVFTPTASSYIPPSQLSQAQPAISNTNPRIPPPIPTDSPTSNDIRKRTFSFSVGMGIGLGRKKSVKAR